MSPKKRITLLRILALVVVVGLSVFIFAIRDVATELMGLGYLGIFLLTFFSYATIVTPAPTLAIIFAAATTYSPIGIALSAGLGAALGEISGYLVGFSSQGIVERKDIYERISRWMQKNGPLTIFLLSVLPNPFFDIAGIAAGMLKMPLKKFFFWCWLGETIKMGAFAYLGYTTLVPLLDWLRQYINI